MKISPNRILYLDEVRSLAIILLVLGHLFRNFHMILHVDSALRNSIIYLIEKVQYINIGIEAK